MALGYDGKLYILAFDHRGSFQKKMFGIEGDPTPEETETIADAKQLIFEGVLEAVMRGAEPGATGVLVDEQFGSDIPRRSREHGLTLAMPVEKSGQNEFDFDYGEDFGAHIEKFDPAFSKVLVRYNPEDDPALKERQLGRLKRLADWLHERDRKFLFELLVPATNEQLATLEGESDRYDAELRPELMRRAIEEIQNAGIEVDVWKIEQWLEAAAPIDGFIGFAIGRSIWWDALKAFLAAELERDAAASEIAEQYLHFVQVYEGQKVH
jgi:myo-inositol catabolism protein IolC